MSSLFGVELPTAVNFVIAFVFVLLLIGIAAWLVRRFGAGRLDAAARGRLPRLAVVDSAAVDNRRKLVIIRRDNVEHLLMIGGPTDVVVETSIVRAAAATARDGAPGRTTSADVLSRPAPESAPRSLSTSEPTAWPLQPEPMPVPPQPTRTDRIERDTPRIEPAPRFSISDDEWPGPAEPAPVPAVAPPVVPVVPAAAPEVRPVVRSADTLAGLAEELSKPENVALLRAEPQPAQRPVQIQPQPRPAPSVVVPQPSPQGNAAADQSLAEMAQRLEAALRRPVAQKVVAETARVTATLEVKAGAPKPATPTRNPAPQPASADKALDDIEQEMANLLNRPGRT